MKLKILALAVPFILAAGAAIAQARITDDRFGCRTKEFMERVYRVANSGDEQAFHNLVNGGFRSGECIRWQVGEQVRVEQRSMGLQCLAKFGSTASCYWTPIEATK